MDHAHDRRSWTRSPLLYTDSDTTSPSCPTPARAGKRSGRVAYLNFIPAFIHFPIIFPWLKAIAFGRYDGNETQVERELPCFVTLIRLIHYEVQWPIGRSQALQQGAPFRRVACLAGRQRERYGCSSIRGNHMNLGSPSATGFSNRLWSVFLMRRYHQDKLLPPYYPARPLQS